MWFNIFHQSSLRNRLKFVIVLVTIFILNKTLFKTITTTQLVEQDTQFCSLPFIVECDTFYLNL